MEGDWVEMMVTEMAALSGVKLVEMMGEGLIDTMGEDSCESLESGVTLSLNLRLVVTLVP